ncbi:hypothetical protein HX021_19995 [Sphingobacterium sp. N143]|uniref:hypothetical protein n=1 Tax=Sphingobacterium sp. N143 TaxID=2746727 RepID=UPI002575F5F0|nr:hypothetical protein [Sphingobacterium sp. N143]MDM1296575.1 hypothetical protein [Sphingobacterium sp. N143]
MKKYALFILLFMGCYIARGQITNISINKKNFESSGFPYKGKRVLQVEHIETAKEDNYIIFSKEERGADPDKLYVQQFQKKEGMWVPIVEETVSEDGIITSVWESRKAFFDADKDGKLDALFIYSRHPKENIEKQLSCIALILYKGQFYRMRAEAEDGYNKTTYSDNYASLPAEVKENVERYWENLDKR